MAVTVRQITVSARIGHGITYSLTCTLAYHVPENGTAPFSNVGLTLYGANLQRETCVCEVQQNLQAILRI